MKVLEDQWGETLRRIEFKGAKDTRVKRDNEWFFIKDKKGRNCLEHNSSRHLIYLDDLVNAEEVVACIGYLLTRRERGWFLGKAAGDLVESLDVYLPLGHLVCGRTLTSRSTYGGSGRNYGKVSLEMFAQTTVSAAPPQTPPVFFPAAPTPPATVARP